MKTEMRDLLEKQIITDANEFGDTTVLASLLEILTDKQIFDALGDKQQSILIDKGYKNVTSNPSEVTTVQDLLTALNSINDKSLPIRFVGLGLEDEEDNCWIESIEVSGTGSSGYEIEGEVRLIEDGVNQQYMCNNCGGGFSKEEMDFDVNDSDLCKNCNHQSFNEAPYND